MRAALYVFIASAWISIAWVSIAWIDSVTRITRAAEPVTYNRDILPLLAEHCFVCHGFDKATRQAGLRLDRFDAATQLLVSGQRAIVPGKPVLSAIVQRIASEDDDIRMPPPETGKRLSAKEIELITRWVAEGAKYESHWAFIPPAVDTSKMAHHKADSMIDVAILADEPETTSASQAPLARADRATLLRRLSLDLTGLPPTSDLVRSFTSDEREDAYERLVDSTLASPRFGERWARWWLDLDHYADSDGYLQDFLRPHAWHYRDWVLEAFNDDLPFDTFTTYQLAGDLLADQRDRAQGITDINRSDTLSKQMRIATGFFRSTLSNREGGADLEEYRVRQAIDRTSTVATTWLGLTIGCAECHDHKYDPISQSEFYQFYSFFNDIDEVNIDLVPEQDAAAFHNKMEDYYRWRAERLSSVADELQRLQQAWEEKLLWTEQHPGVDHRLDRELEVLGLIWGQGEGEGQLEGINIIKIDRDKRTRSQQARLQDYFLSHGSSIDSDAFKRLNVSGMLAEIQKKMSELPKPSRAQTIVKAVRPRVTFIHTRGDFRRPGAVVQPGVPAAITNGDQPVTDRLLLAQWLTRSDHPLTARVVVNRLWQELFGAGIVLTSENLGVRGSRATHAVLLDYLARRLIEREWSLKAVLREIVLSDAYQYSTAPPPSTQAAASADGNSRTTENDSEHSQQSPVAVRSPLQRRLRLSAESMRDAMLTWGGLIDLRIAGPSVRPPQPESVAMEGFDNKWVPDQGANRYRRGLYTFLQRTSPFAQSITFDLPDTSRSCSRRERSNTPLQALTLLNDPVLFEAALGAARTTMHKKLDEHSTASPDQQRIEELFLTVLSRQPTSLELEQVEKHLNAQRAIYAADQEAYQQLFKGTSLKIDDLQHSSELAAWAMTASVLMNLDESITRN